MKGKIYQKIKSANRTLLAALVDPDKAGSDFLSVLCDFANKKYVDVIFVGGSLTFKSVDETIDFIKRHTQVPVILYPGSPLQISFKADAILFLSLISGRNPEYLIGHHITVAKQLKDSGLEIIPTGYILIEGEKTSATEYISNTKPIPADKPEIAVATAVAGELLGMKMIYLEAGSGAKKSVNYSLIREVKRNLDIPLIVGGGIKNEETLEKTVRAGADLVVIGTAIEQNIYVLPNFFGVIKKVFSSSFKQN